MIHFGYVIYFFFHCFSAYEDTFLLQHQYYRTKKCLYQDIRLTNIGIIKFVLRNIFGECNDKDGNFRWIWTKSGQILHWETLECMSVDYLTIFKNYYAYTLYYVVLKKCDQKQSWECTSDGQNKKYIRLLENSNMYMDYGELNTYVTTRPLWHSTAQWRRYDTQKDVCSQGNFKNQYTTMN